MSAGLPLRTGHAHSGWLSVWSAFRSVQNASRADAASFRREQELPPPGLPSVSWIDAEQRLRDLLDLPPDWDSYGGSAPAPELIAYAAAELNGLKALRLPPPVITSSGDGQILAAWRGHGIEVELWFEAPYRETVVVDDDRAGGESFEGTDPQLAVTIRALRRIGTGV